MTTIAGMVHDGTVTISTDSAATSGDGRRWHRTRPKIARLTAPGAAPVLIATTGPTALNAFVHFHLKLDAAPEPNDDADCDSWAQAVADAITSWAAAAQPTVLDDGHLDGTALLGYAGRLWTIREHHADRIATPYIGLGSGGDLALGALAVAYPDVLAGRMQAADATRLAVQVAATWDDGTAGEIHCEQLTIS